MGGKSQPRALLGHHSVKQALKSLLQQEKDAQRAKHPSQGGDTSSLPHMPQTLPLGTTPMPHEPGRWQQGRQGTDLLSSTISIIPVPAAWAPLELPSSPVQELRANPGTHSIGATKQFSHKNILISRGQRAFFLPGVGSLGRAAQPCLGGQEPTASHQPTGAHSTPQNTKYSVPRVRAEPATSAGTCYKLTDYAQRCLRTHQLTPKMYFL